MIWHYIDIIMQFLSVIYINTFQIYNVIFIMINVIT